MLRKVGSAVLCVHLCALHRSKLRESASWRRLKRQDWGPRSLLITWYHMVEGESNWWFLRTRGREQREQTKGLAAVEVREGLVASCCRIHPLIACYLWWVERYVWATCFSAYTHPKPKYTLRDPVTLEGVICARRRSVGGFYGRYAAGSLLLEERWYLLIKLYPTLL